MRWLGSGIMIFREYEDKAIIIMVIINYSKFIGLHRRSWIRGVARKKIGSSDFGRGFSL